MEHETTAEPITVSDLETMSGAVNYRAWMYHRLAPYIGRRILEVGAGIGNFTSLLLDRELVVALDTHAPCVDALRTRLRLPRPSVDGARVLALQMDIAKCRPEDLPAQDFDTVICLNVLEHIEDDERALKIMRAVLRQDGRLVLLVPAFQFLYGTVDRSLQHYRRYTRKTLLPKLLAAGFVIDKSFYMNVIGTAGWFLNNRLLKRREESPRQILTFDRFVAPWADRIERLVPPPFGLSLIAICRKQT